MGFNTLIYYLLVLRRQRMVAGAILGSVLLAAVVLAFVLPPVYETKGQLLFKQPNSTTALVGLDNELGRLSALNNRNSPVDNEAEILLSPPLVRRVIKELSLTGKDGQPLEADDFLKIMKVVNVKGTDILELTYTGYEPALNEKIINQLMGYYLANNVQINRAEAVSARRFIEGQLPKVEANVARAELALRQFRESNRIVDLPEEARSVVGVITSLDNQVAGLKSDVSDAQAQRQALQTRLGLSSQQAVDLSALNRSAGVQEVLTQLQKVQAEKTLQATRYQPEHPTIQGLTRKEAALQTLLTTRIKEVLGKGGRADKLQLGDLNLRLMESLVTAEVRYLGLSSKLAALSQVGDPYRARAQAIPRLLQGDQVLQRKLLAAQNTYQLLLQKLQEVRVSENQNIGNARIISPGFTTANPVWPSKLVFGVLGLLAGSLLAFIAALVLEARDATIKTVGELRTQFPFPLLGVVPVFPLAPRQNRLPSTLAPVAIVRDQPQSFLSEVFRMIQSNLRFLHPDMRCFVVTSAVAGEGKSTVSLNLALAMAQLNRRVLLIDTDLRFPSQHLLWSTTNGPGLTHVLMGQIALDQAILHEIQPGLSLLPAGQVPPNPLALLDGEPMIALLKQCRRDYDVVILDAPPLLDAAEALTLSRLSDSVVLVSRPGVVDFSSAAACRELLAPLRVLGLVINGVVPENEPDSYYHRAKPYGYAQKTLVLPEAL